MIKNAAKLKTDINMATQHSLNSLFSWITVST